MEEAAQTLRANRWRTFVDVSLPLMRPRPRQRIPDHLHRVPSRTSAIPSSLGGNFGVLSDRGSSSPSSVPSSIRGAPRRWEILLLLFALAAFFAQRRLLGRKVYTALAGKGDAGLPTRLPDGVRRLCYLDRPALGRRLRSSSTPWRLPRLRRAMGTRLHAHAQALCEGVLGRARPRRHHLDRSRLEFPLDHGRALGDRPHPSLR